MHYYYILIGTSQISRSMQKISKNYYYWSCTLSFRASRASAFSSRSRFAFARRAILFVSFLRFWRARLPGLIFTRGPAPNMPGRLRTLAGAGGALPTSTAPSSSDAGAAAAAAATDGRSAGAGRANAEPRGSIAPPLRGINGCGGTAGIAALGVALFACPGSGRKGTRRRSCNAGNLYFASSSRSCSFCTILATNAAASPSCHRRPRSRASSASLTFVGASFPSLAISFINADASAAFGLRRPTYCPRTPRT